MGTSRARGILSCLVVLFLAAGCFQQSGSPSDITPISQALPTSTPVLPTDTPRPPASDTPTDEPTPRALPTSSPTRAVATEVGVGGSLVQVTSPSAATLAVGTPIAQADTVQQQPEDPLNITATAIIQRATQTQAANLTATWFAQFGTPTPIATATTAPLPGVTPSATVAPRPDGACVHTVVAGDNLFRISLRYNVTINDIAAANGISTPNIIVVGQQLTIPGCTSGGSPTTPTTPVPSGGQTYTVQQGDTLFEISMRFGVPVNSIAAANGISNINLIYINQQLRIPPA